MVARGWPNGQPSDWGGYKMKLFLAIIIACAMAPFAFANTDTTINIKEEITATSFFGPRSFIEYVGLQVPFGSWLTGKRDFYPTSTPNLAKRYLELITKYPIKKDEKSYRQKMSPQERSDYDAIKNDIVATLSKSATYEVNLKSEPKTEDSQATEAEFKTQPVVGASFRWNQNFAVLGLKATGKFVGIVKVKCQSSKDKGPEWVLLAREVEGEPDLNGNFELDFTKNPNIVDQFNPQNADDVALIDGSKKSGIKRVEFEIQRVVSGGILNLSGIGSSNSRDAEANLTLNWKGRRLVSLNNFRTDFFGVNYEANQLGTNQLATINVGTNFFLDVPIGRTPTGEVGFRSYMEIKAETGYWTRQDVLTAPANAKRAGSWLTADMAIGPIFVAGGKTAFYAKATGYYFPMKDRTFGNNVNTFEGYIKAGMLIPLGVSDTDLKTGKGNWINLSYANGAERANAFANKSSFAFTFVTALKF